MGSPNIGLVVGDSLGNEADEFVQLLNWPVQNECGAGNALITDIEPAFLTTLANRPDGTAFCVIQGGVNDCAADATAAAIQAAVTSVVNASNAAGLETLVVSIAPWAASASWSSARQTVTDSYNTWLAANDAALSYTYVDAYTILEDGSTPDNLDAAYDSGDGIHPNVAGSFVLADAINTQLDALSLYNTGDNMNLYMDRGAVQAPDAGTSTNQLGLWRGAIEPAATVTALSGILFPKDSMPTSEARFETFIASTGITRSGCLATDYRRALCSILGIVDENSVSIDDVFKRYINSL